MRGGCFHFLLVFGRCSFSLNNVGKGFRLPAWFIFGSTDEEGLNCIIFHFFLRPTACTRNRFRFLLTGGAYEDGSTACTSSITFFSPAV